MATHHPPELRRLIVIRVEAPAAVALKAGGSFLGTTLNTIFSGVGNPLYRTTIPAS